MDSADEITIIMNQKSMFHLSAACAFAAVVFTSQTSFATPALEARIAELELRLEEAEADNGVLRLQLDMLTSTTTVIAWAAPGFRSPRLHVMV